MAGLSIDTEHIIEDAFEQAFSPVSESRRSSKIIPAQTPVTEVPAEPTPTPAEPTTAPSESTSPEGTTTGEEEDPWKQEYEEQVKTWRTQSAEAREKAEKTREEWEAKRAAEREELAKWKAAGQPVPEPEIILGPQPSMTSSAVLVHHEEKEEEKSAKETGAEASEHRKHVTTSATSQHDTVEGSQRWEEVDSPSTSSYPSMSFPEQSTPPLESNHDDHDHDHKISHKNTQSQTATLVVFDSTLSTRTRLKAFASSLAINLLLPFVNGVMLGFGEIFAKNIVLKWFRPGYTAATVGISQRQSGRQEDRR